MYEIAINYDLSLFRKSHLVRRRNTYKNVKLEEIDK